MKKKKTEAFAGVLLAGHEGKAVNEPAAWRAFELLFEHNPHPMWIYDRKTMRFLEVNDAAIHAYGYSRDEFLRMTLTDIRPAEDVTRLKRILEAPAERGYKVSTGWQHRRKDGSFIFVTIHSREIPYQGHDAALVMAADVTELHELIEKLEAQTLYFQQLFANSPDGIVLLDHEGRIVDVNVAFQEIFGFERDELLGNTPLSLIVSKEDSRESRAMFSRNVDGNEPVRAAAIRRHKSGRKIEVEILAYPIRGTGKDLGVFAIYHDITARQRVLAELEHQARHDMLTDLVNRAEFTRNIETLIDVARSNRSRHALLYLDIDQFKVINDTCGHSAGDRAIVELSGLLQSTLRGMDIVARLGGDEFGILMPNCDSNSALKRAQQLQDVVGNWRFTWNTRQFPIAVSIGIVEIDATTSGVEEVLSAADAACYAAKEKGRNRIQRYDATDAHFVSRKEEIEWVSKLGDAIDTNRFVLYCQEIRSLSGDDEAHGEILIRYRGEDGELVAPGLFVPAAERYNIMPSIDRWVVLTVCERLAKSGPKPQERLSINVSGTTLSDESFPEFIKQTLAATGVAGSLLCFEITETAAIANLALATRFIEEMKSLGCGIALDDFGSGMSSFSYLRELNVDYLKIDGTFVRNLHVNEVDHAMTEAINNVGKILGLKTIAEFVENEEIIAHLRDIGVDYAQGYGVHKPVPWRE